jgi:phage gp36-like protein
VPGFYIMSAYTTQQAIQGNIHYNDLVALTDDTNSGQLNQAVLQQVIENASGVVDMFCANIYGNQIPFNPVPSSVASMTLTIACYMLFERAQIPPEQNKFFPRYKMVMNFLQKVNSGEMHLDDVIDRDYSPVQFVGRSTIFGPMYSNFPANSM